MRTASIVGLAMVSAALGCGSGRQTAPQAPVPPTQSIRVARTADKQATDVPSKSNIVIAENIRKACGIADQDAHFTFDSAAIRRQDTQILSEIARCFNTGPLRGRNAILVGHADPRGDDEYNMVLGGRRAENVKHYVGRAGLGLARMETSSRGEMDSTGHDEGGWAMDRRVDLMLAN